LRTRDGSGRVWSCGVVDWTDRSLNEQPVAWSDSWSQTHHGAQEREGERKKETKNYQERERRKLRLKRQKQSTQEKERDREYHVTRAAHIGTQWHAVTAHLSLPIHIQHHHTCSSVGKRNTFWVTDSCRGSVPVVSQISK